LGYYYLKKMDKACKDWKKAASLGSTAGQTAVDKYCQKR